MFIFGEQMPSVEKLPHGEKGIVIGKLLWYLSHFFSICKELSLVYKHERVGIKEHMETTHYLIQLVWKFNLIRRKRRIFFFPLQQIIKKLILSFISAVKTNEPNIQTKFPLA